MEEIRLMLRKFLIVLLIVWMVAVFGLSQQTGSESGSLSRAVANFFARGDVKLAESLEPMIRKVAHMTEYAMGGMIFYGILLTYPDKTRKTRAIASLLFIVLYASTDELHQLFIDARNGNIVDVFIDTFGGLLGIGAMFIIETSIAVIENSVHGGEVSQSQIEE